MVLSALISSPKVGVLIPIPQYPLYTASIALCNGVPAPYYLNEDKGWSLDMDEVIKGLYDARAKGVDVRAIVIINPGNPTGNVLAEDTIRDIIDLCHREQLLLLADEVYQTNVYTPEKPFHSFKKVLKSCVRLPSPPPPLTSLSKVLFVSSLIAWAPNTPISSSFRSIQSQRAWLASAGVGEDTSSAAALTRKS